MFYAALQSYLQARQQQAASATQLWSAVASSTGEDVASWMQPWTYRPGFPVITVQTQGLDVLVSQVRPLISARVAT